ncbi:hypothetical protein ACFVAJ_17720 [Agromyces sp. NPDC057679]|uniref:hypothetical protein n=1 Tax=Agromyces sp. NPDC057679 TaxID=3346207 RepID=UPI00366BA0FB
MQNLDSFNHLNDTEVSQLISAIAADRGLAVKMFDPLDVDDDLIPAELVDEETRHDFRIEVIAEALKPLKEANDLDWEAIRYAAEIVRERRAA